MPLEATMMIIDNSEYMRNGDYQPTRFEAQSDAVTTIFQTKTDSNPENTVGIMTMACKGPEVLVTNTKDLGQILKAMHDVSSKIGGSIDLPTAIAIAQLALKHRENKNLRQRIIVFVGSPLEGPGADEKGMVKLAKKLKKNNIAVDLVSFGDGIEEGEKNVLKTFVDNASNGDNSHIISVPPGAHLLSDAIISSPILSGDRGIPEEAMGDASGSHAGAGPATVGAGYEFGVDPSLDPELAMALRMSMQDEQARLAAESQARAAAPPSPSAAPPAADSTATTAETTAGAVSTSSADEVDPDDEALQQALALSQEGGGDVAMDDEMDEEEAIAKAIEMSMKQDEEEQDKK